MKPYQSDITNQSLNPIAINNFFFFYVINQDLNRTEFQFTFPTNGVDCVFLKVVAMRMKAGWCSRWTVCGCVTWRKSGNLATSDFQNIQQCVMLLCYPKWQYVGPFGGKECGGVVLLFLLGYNVSKSPNQQPLLLKIPA